MHDQDFALINLNLKLLFCAKASFSLLLVFLAQHLSSCSILGPVSQTQFILQFIIFLESAAERKATLSSHNHTNILQKTNDIMIEGGGEVFFRPKLNKMPGAFLGQTKLFRALSLLMNIFVRIQFKKVLSNISEQRR